MSCLSFLIVFNLNKKLCNYGYAAPENSNGTIAF